MAVLDGHETRILPRSRVLAVKAGPLRLAGLLAAQRADVRGDGIDQRRNRGDVGLHRRPSMPSCCAASAVTGPIAATTVFLSRSAACSAP